MFRTNSSDKEVENEYNKDMNTISMKYAYYYYLLFNIFKSENKLLLKNLKYYSSLLVDYLKNIS